MEINWNGSRLFYEKSGSGSKIMLLFHGYGQDHSIFNSSCQSLSDEYTCYSFDLFFHGKSLWAETTPISIAFLGGLFAHFLETEKINRFSALGYSIGSRFLIPLLIHFPEKIAELILVAPDGIRDNLWFRIATGSSLGRKFFEATIDHPRYFSILTRIAQMFRIVPDKVLRFAEHQMRSDQKRRRVFQSWTFFRDLRLSVNEWISRINRDHIHVILIIGTTDPLIQSGLLTNFVRRIQSITTKEIEGGHNRVLKVLSRELESVLIDRNDNRR